jgi:hypothetical protein
VKRSRVLLGNPIFDLDHQGPAAAAQRQPDLGIVKHHGLFAAPADARHAQPQADERRSELDAGARRFL